MNAKSSLFSMLVASLILAISTQPVSAAPRNADNQFSVPVVGTFSPSTTSGPLSSLGSGVFKGSFQIHRFAQQSQQVVAIGTLTGTLLDSSGAVLRTIAAPNVAMPLANQQPRSAVALQQLECSILNLDLAPLHLDLLGLVVDLDEVILNIVAAPGAGNLLGNLLCAITGLLNGVGSLVQLTLLLNQLLDILG
jgi:hypothetical protein